MQGEEKGNRRIRQQQAIVVSAENRQGQGTTVKKMMGIPQVEERTGTSRRSETGVCRRDRRELNLWQSGYVIKSHELKQRQKSS